MIALFLLLLLLIFIFSIPAVQTESAQRLTEKINSEFGTDIKIERLSLTYNARVNLKNVYIGDHHNDTLISSRSLRTSIVNIRGLIKGENIDFGGVTAKNLTFRLRRYEGDDKDSFGIFLDKLEKENPNEKKAPRVNLKHLFVIDSKFSFFDEQAVHSDIVSLENLNIDASDFIIHGSDISVKINALRAKEHRGIDIGDLSLVFTFKNSQMNFDDFHLVTPESDIRAKVHFSYENNMHDFENRVKIDADFFDSEISTSDLKRYYEPFGNAHILRFSGAMGGVLNDFQLENFVVNGLYRTGVDGAIRIRNIFGEEDFQLDADLNRLTTDYNDLVNLLPSLLKDPLPENLKKLGQAELRGKLGVVGASVYTTSMVKTAIGEADLDGRLYDLQLTDNEKYSGSFKVKNFDLGEYLDDPTLGEASLVFSIDGKGFEQKTLDTYLDVHVENIRYGGYTYKDIQLNGKLKHPIFTGSLRSLDPNLILMADGSADVSRERADYNLNAEVARADLQALRFMNKDSTAIFKGKIALNLQGHDINDLEGRIDLNEVSYENRQGIHDFEELNLTSSFDGVVRNIGINSPDILNGKMEGYFNLTEFPDLVRNALGNLYSNYRPIPIARNQYIDFDIAIYNKFIEALFPDVSLSANTTLWGKIRSSNSDLKVEFNSPEMRVYQNTFKQVDLKLDNQNPLSTTNFTVGEVSGKSYDFSDIRLISTRKNDTLYLRSQLKGGVKQEDEFNLNFFHTIDKDNKSVVGIRRSTLKFRDNTWYLNKDRVSQGMVFDNEFKTIKVDTISLEHNDQKITFSGTKQGSHTKDFKLDFHHTDLGKVTPIIEDFDFKGIINGGLRVVQQDGTYYPSSDLKISDFIVNNIDYGDLYFDITGDQSLTSYVVAAKMTENNRDYLMANGTINVSKNSPSIDLDLELDQFKIGILNAFGGEVIENIRGKASGKAHIGGNYKKPEIMGELQLENSGLKIPYLNIDLAFEEKAKVQLSEQEFYFDQVGFEDTKEHTGGEVNGSISHSNFLNWGMDLNINAPERLLALDTDYTEEALYYGKAYISGNAHIYGPFDELIIDVNAASEKGTAFKIPLSDSESLAENQYIYFLTPEDKKARKEGKDIILRKLKGLAINFDLDITDDAEIEVVVDKKSGSSLRGNGAGTLLMEINTTGKFNMWGDFVVYNGVYNFKYAGLIEKEFEVVSGGSITWDGSPTQANLNVRALYQTEANPASLLENPTINRSIPVNVYVDLSGLLTNVDINFELEYPNLSSVVRSELEYRISDRQDTEIQALSLITQRSFYSEMGVGRTAHPENILYERAAGLFNDIFSSEEDKFKVGVNYTKGNRSPDQEITDQVGVTLSTNVNDRILINGRVGVPIGGLTESVVVGNVEIEFLLNEAGNLRAKIFNRESDIQYIGEELGYTQGAGLTYSLDFDSFKEMIQKIIKKQPNATEIPKELEEKAEKESLVPDYIKFPGH